MDGGFCLKGLKDAIDVRVRLAVFEAIIEEGLLADKPPVGIDGLACKKTQFARLVNRFQSKNHPQEHESAQNKSQNCVCPFAFHNESGKTSELTRDVQRVFAAEKLIWPGANDIGI